MNNPPRFLTVNGSPKSAPPWRGRVLKYYFFFSNTVVKIFFKIKQEYQILLSEASPPGRGELNEIYIEMNRGGLLRKVSKDEE